MATKTQFIEAVARLLGPEKFKALSASDFTAHDFCREVAQEQFVGAILPSATTEDDLELVRQVAKSLWKGEGITGLTEG